MENTELLVHTTTLEVAGGEYEVRIYTRNDGSHVAKTCLGPQDVIINDGFSLHEALDKHRKLLPLAIDSRLILRDFQNGRALHVN